MNENEIYESMLEEINEYSEGLETEEELKELITEMENRWYYRRISGRLIDGVIDDFIVMNGINA